MTTPLLTVTPATCTFCGCACDDIELHGDGEHIGRAERACPLGVAGFTAVTDSPAAPALIDGHPATLDEAIGRGADLLAQSRAPLICGLSHSTCEAQRAAVALADRVGAFVDAEAHTGDQAPGMLFPSIGEVTCSLGEVKNRADLLVYWGGNPAVSHPRLAERYGHDAIGTFVPNGRTDRTVVVVGERATAEALGADRFIALAPDATFAALWQLRALVMGKTIVPTDPRTDDWAELAAALARCQFGVLFLSPEPGGDAPRPRDLEAAYGLATDLNVATRFYVLPLRGAGNPVGAEQVLTWQSGYASAVSFQRGWPRSFAREFSANRLLARNAVDAVLMVRSHPSLTLVSHPTPHAAPHAASALSVWTCNSAQSSIVTIATAPAQIAASGTVYRLDEIAVPLRPAIRSSFPSEDQVLRQIDRRLRERTAAV